MTRLAGTDHGVRRAARPLGIGPAGSSQSRSVTPTASGRARGRVTALSTPPLIATATRPGLGAARNTCASAFATASAARVSPGTPPPRAGSARRAARPCPARPLPRCARRRRRDERTQRRHRARSRRLPRGASIHRSACMRPGVAWPAARSLANLPQGHSRVPDVTLSAEDVRVDVDFVPSFVPTLTPVRRGGRRAVSRVRRVAALPALGLAHHELEPVPPRIVGHGTATCPGSRRIGPRDVDACVAESSGEPPRAPRSSRRGAPDVPWSRV